MRRACGERLGTGWVDLHYQHRDDEEGTAIGRRWGAMAELKREGKVTVGVWACPNARRARLGGRVRYMPLLPRRRWNFRFFALEI